MKRAGWVGWCMGQSLVAAALATMPPAGVALGQQQPQYHQPQYQQQSPQQRPPAQPHQPGQPPAQIPLHVQPPFELTPEQERRLDAVLAAWETQTSRIKTLKCGFVRMEYDPVFGPKDQHKVESFGELKYAKPDRGSFEVTETREFNPSTRKYHVVESAPGEHWVCTGEAVYSVDHPARLVRVFPIPAELRGKAISDGPLPFVFGAEAAKLKQRYWMRELPPTASGEIWLEALPKLAQDARQYSKVMIILNARDMLPMAVQLHEPGGPGRTVYTFDPKSRMFDLQQLLFPGAFVAPPTPRGYQQHIEGGSQATAAAPAGPGAAHGSRQ